MANLLEKETITLRDALKHLDSGQPFNLVYVEADRRRGTGGELATRKGWVKLMPAAKVQGATRPEYKSRVAKAIQDTDPNHFHNKTRNIIYLKSRTIKKLHTKLIVEYNGKNVVL